MKLRLVALVVVLLASVPGGPAGTAQPMTGLRADPDAPAVAQTNPRLVGVGWDRAHFTAELMEPLAPNLVRIDAGFEHLYPAGPDISPAARDALLEEIGQAIGIGGEPVLILSYMPAWLADAYPGDFRDRTKLPPRDVDVWRGLVREVVGLTAAAGVRWFEVWNEPDWPAFYQDTLGRFLADILRPGAEVVRDVTIETGLPLRFGGCACLFPNPSWIVPMLAYVRAYDLPLDFLSWHYYANYPFIGPDGMEPIGSPEQRALLQALARRNPTASPSEFGHGVHLVRGWRDAILAGTGRSPDLVVDEWNLSAAGFDLRHDTHEGAAFAAASLVEMQRAGLDRSAYFRSVDPAYSTDVVPHDPELFGGWGLVGRRGTVKPAYDAFRFWGELGEEILQLSSVADAADGLFALVTRRDPADLRILAANFRAEGAADRVLHVALRPGDRWTVRVQRAGEADTSVTRDVADRLAVALPAQSATLIVLERTG